MLRGWGCGDVVEVVEGLGLKGWDFGGFWVLSGLVGVDEGLGLRGYDRGGSGPRACT